MNGELVISLDFELLWGVRDHASRESYGSNILGAREAIPRILDLFERYDIAATWATVGLLMAESRDELIDSLPPEDLRPKYNDLRLSNYRYLDEVGEDERRDPYYYGMSLVRRIVECPHQEIGTHTHSHFYCLERGQTVVSFEADLAAACKLARTKGITMRSIVFPRNQFSPEYLDACMQHGINTYRGNPKTWAYRATDGSSQTSLRRVLRLVDAHTGIFGAKTYFRSSSLPLNVPASQFLRPKVGRLAHLHPAHIHMIKRAMTTAALHGEGFHLWWHPHNFGSETSANLAALEDILQHFKCLKDRSGFASKSMMGSNG